MFELLHIKIQIRFTFRVHDFWCCEYPKALFLYNFLLFCKYPLLILSLTCFLFLLYFLKQNWLEIFQNVSETQRFFWDANAVHFLTSSTFFWSVLVFSFLPFFFKAILFLHLFVNLYFSLPASLLVLPVGCQQHSTPSPGTSLCTPRAFHSVFMLIWRNWDLE